MPGLYLHIPFCKQACHYCNFHFSTSLRNKTPLLQAMLSELELQKNYLQGQALGSVYFGGGTPSLLEIRELVQIFEKIFALHPLLPGAEITLEANPDDLTPEKLRDLRTHTPVNRLSIGIQSFAEIDLRWMNRAHTATHARDCVNNALAAGFDHLTLDLIYGSPSTSDAQWAENLQTVFDFGVPHLSCYCLTVEDGTALGHSVKKGKQPPMDEEKAARQFEYLMDATAAAGYEQYEISNFARPGCHARHNTNYWRDEAYLGIGPAAHSFDGNRVRQSNVANNAHYIKALSEGRLDFSEETLSPRDRYNEYVMTSLRTMWGCDLEKIRQLGAVFADYFEQTATALLREKILTQENGHFCLTRQGKLLADGIAARLFFPR